MISPVSALIVAGEASGDQHAAALVRCLSRQQPVAWFGLGGDVMQAAGVELIEHAQAINVLGLVEVLVHLPRIYWVLQKLMREVDRRRPTLALLVGSPGFNLPLARRLHGRGFPVVFFIPPQIWAWRPRRLRHLQRCIRKVLCIFPFEEHIYQRAGMDVAYVGHPLVGRVAPTMRQEEFFAREHLDPSRPLVCLLPGSRSQEVARHLPRMIAAAELLASTHQAQFVLVRAATVERAQLESQLPPELAVRVVEGPAYNALAASAVAVVASGTATVEAALLETPMVVIYAVASPSWWLGRWLVHTPYYSMVNLIAGQRVVPELIQNNFTPERVAWEVSGLLMHGDTRQSMKRELRTVRARLGEPGAIERATAAILPLLTQTTPIHAFG